MLFCKKNPDNAEYKAIQRYPHSTILPSDQKNLRVTSISVPSMVQSSL